MTPVCIALANLQVTIAGVPPPTYDSHLLLVPTGKFPRHPDEE